MKFDLFASDLDSVIQNNSKGLASLCKTKKIEEADLVDPIWRGLDAQYRNSKTALALDLVSVANAIYHQRRKVFCFSRSNAELVMKSDPRRNGGYDNNRYKKFMAQAQSLGLFEPIRKPVLKGSNKKPGIYKVIEPRLVAALRDVDAEAQLQECLDFIADKERRQGEQTGSADTGLGAGLGKGGGLGEGQGRGNNPPSSSSFEEKPKGKPLVEDEIKKTEADASLPLTQDHSLPFANQQTFGSSEEYKDGDQFWPTRESLAFVEETKKRFMDGITDLPAVGSNTTEWKQFSNALKTHIRDHQESLFNLWGDHCDDWVPEDALIAKAIDEALSKRFTEKAGKWSLNGEIGQRARSIIEQACLGKKKRKTRVKFRGCSPTDWKTYNKVSKIEEAREALTDDFLTAIMSPEAQELAKIAVSSEEHAIYLRVKASEDKKSARENAELRAYHAEMEGIPQFDE